MSPGGRGVRPELSVAHAIEACGDVLRLQDLTGSGTGGSRMKSGTEVARDAFVTLFYAKTVRHIERAVVSSTAISVTC